VVRPPPTPLIYVDSDVYLDLVKRSTDPHPETGEERWRMAKRLFDAVNQDQVRLASSALIEAEVCCNGLSRKNSARVRELLRGWFTAPATVWTDADRYLARAAVIIMNDHRDKGLKATKMSSADAVHLAAAIRLEADYFMSYDNGFPHGHTVEGVRVQHPNVVWQETLFQSGDESA
jgi:predicted nucleic acid-binding protein